MPNVQRVPGILKCGGKRTGVGVLFSINSGQSLAQALHSGITLGELRGLYAMVGIKSRSAE